jgi:hypothetical protein
MWIHRDLSILQPQHFPSIQAKIAIHFDRMKLAALDQAQHGDPMAPPQFGDFIHGQERVGVVQLRHSGHFIL